MNLFFKNAALLPIHEKVCKGIINEPCTEVHKYMDREKGRNHREIFGHDKDAENNIKDKKDFFGEKGWDGFVLHILTDRTGAYDNIDEKTINEIKAKYEDIKNGIGEIPYYA